MSDKTKKICFVVTPIGGKDTPIRRHIEGIIDHAIIPALESKYEVEVAHRKYEIGSINDRIINSIYSADLVIANLTTLNPNVMFELAIRYSFGKPAIVIAEQGTQLPFDIIDENTIFYENDPTGAHVLKEQLIKFESNIVFDDKKYGPVHKALGTAALYKDIESGKEVSNEKLFRYIINKLDVMEKDIRFESSIEDRGYFGVELRFKFKDNTKKEDIVKTTRSFWEPMGSVSVPQSLKDPIRVEFNLSMDKGPLDVILQAFQLLLDDSVFCDAQLLYMYTA